MRYACLTGLALIGGMFSGFSNAQIPSQGSPPPIKLDHRVEAFEVGTAMQVWLDNRGTATIQDVAKMRGRGFSAKPPGEFHPLRSGNALWLHLRLEAGPLTPAAWTLNVPLPYLDLATLYESDGAGGWIQQSAGDSIAMRLWPTPGLYPQFSLNVLPGAGQDVFLQVRNVKPVSLPIRLATIIKRQQQAEIEHLGIGLMLGSLLMLTAWCGIQFLARRSPADGWYMLYSLLMILAIANATGMAAQFLWPKSPVWADLAHGTLPLLAVGATLLFVRHLCALSSRYPRFDLLVAGFAWGAIMAAFLYLVLDRSLADIGFTLIMGASPVPGVSSIALAWRRANPAAPWLMAAFVPQGIVLTGLILQSIGLLPATWGMRYVLVGAVALAVPLLLHAMNLRLRDRKEAQVRAEHLPTQDALTGLLTPAVFAAQLRDVIGRALEDKEPAAVVLVSVVNYDQIKRAYGDTTAEQCLLRAVVKLHRVLRDVDPAGRVGNAQFGLIIEGVKSREDLSERMVKLISSGLIPIPGLKPEVMLNFHVAAVLLTERIAAPASVLAELGQLLSGVSPRTRRPIRFLEPEATAPAPLEAVSSFLGHHAA